MNTPLGTPEGTRLHFCPWGRNGGSRQCLHWWQQLPPAYCDLIFRVPFRCVAPNKIRGYPTGHPLTILVTDMVSQSYGLRLHIRGLSHGLRNMPPACSLHQCKHWCRPFESLSGQQKSRYPNGYLLFWYSEANQIRTEPGLSQSGFYVF